MPSRAYSLRLDGLSAPNGEIPMRDLIDIGSALQLTATRIARQLAGQPGRGRSTTAVERWSELRLSGLSAGSTVLEIHLGDVAAMELVGGDEETVATRFEEMFASIAKNEAPTWADAGVIGAIGKVAAGLRASGARRASVDRGAQVASSPLPAIDVAKIDLAIWTVSETRNTEHVTITGMLDKVDLRARRFRVRDDVGNDVTLDDVVDVSAAAQLIGRRVVASGIAERERGRMIRIIEPMLVTEELPPEWFAQLTSSTPVGAAIGSGGIAGVTETEVHEFLAELRR